MNNINEQNGRQLSSEQAAPPTDPRTRGLRAVAPTPESQRICRDFVWGICSMNEHCKYRHELEYESMRAILKFCHDYQNRTGCTRPECTYLHASREEENLFLTSGVIPRVLVERYASMSAPSEPASEPVPSMMYMNEYVAPPPPPPPPPCTQSSAPAAPSLPGPSTMGPQMMAHMTGSMAPAMSQISMSNMMQASMSSARAPEPPGPSHQMPLTVKTNMHAVMPTMTASASAPMPTILAPPPPPPPPPTITTAPTQMAPPVYTAAQPLQHSVPTIYPVTPPLQQQPQAQSPQYGIPIMYDPSRPPPPILKRPAPSDSEGAGPSKLLKVDDDPICDSCIENNLRLALDQQEIEKLQREEEYRRRVYDQNSEEYENGHVLLRSVLTPQIFRIVDEFLEMNASSSDILGANSSPTYVGNSATAIPKQLLFQLMELLISKRNSDQLTSPLELFTRRSTSQTELIVASIMELLQNGVSSESRITSVLESIGGNGLGRLAGLSSGALELPSSSRYVPPAPRYSAASVQYPATNGEVVSPAAPYQAEPAPAPAVYVPYQPSPAPRPFYQPYGAAPAPPPPAPAQPYQPQPQPHQPQPHQPQPHQPQPHQPQPHQPQPHQPQAYHVPRMPHFFPPYQ